MRRTLFVVAALAVLCLAGPSQADYRSPAGPGLSPRLPSPYPLRPRPYPWWWYRPYPVYVPVPVPSPWGGYVDPPPVAPPAPPATPAAPADSGIEVSGPLSVPPPHRAVINLRLPSTWAKVSFDGQKIDSIGASRYYVTPELTGLHSYEVSVTWTQRGRTVTVQQSVPVRAGQVRTVDFTRPAD